MKHRQVSLLIAVLAAAALTTGCGMTAPRSSQGYADLGTFAYAGTDNTMSLSLGPAVLGFAANFVEDDPTTRELLRNLDGVRVKTYTVGDYDEQLALHIDAISSQLQKEGWEPVVVVLEDSERTHVLVKMDGADIAGLTVLNYDDQDLVLINVMGNLPPQSFARAMAALDADVTP